MAKQSQNIVAGRATLGTAFGLIGTAGLLFAVMAFAWYLTFSAAVVIALVVGLVGYVAWAAIAPKEFVATFTGRQARYSTGATFAALLLLGIIILVYIIVARAGVIVDVTASRTYSLSQTTLDLFERIPEGRTVQITGFYSSQALERRALDDQFLRQYELESDGRVVVEYINPQEQPAIAQSFGVQVDGELFISMLDEDGNIDFDTLVFVARENKQERDVTSALQRMITRRVLTVYYAENVSTLSIFDEGGEGLTLLDNDLRYSGILTGVLNLQQLAANGESIPSDAAALVLARPRLNLLEEEVDLIREYMATGGSLLVLSDITFNDAEFLAEGTPFNDFLTETYGLRALDAVVIDPPYQVETPLDIIAAATYLEHPIGIGIPETATTFFRVARPVQALAEKPPTVANGRIMASSPQSYAETDIERLLSENEYEIDPDADIQGPVDLVVWAQDVEDNGGNGSKVVLIGDGNFVMNENVSAGAEGNGALFRQSLSWLTGSGETLGFGFSADPSAIPTLFISGRQLDLIGMVTVVLVPLSVLFVGLIVWYRRTFA